ncbi:hypothetical protein B566_EDAN013238 [Ephemera danica]|nr:hypothetical protein B566_EDAN013238 [Ephemera danica]
MKFTSYFDSGLTPAQAVRLHTSSKIVIKKQHDIWAVLILSPIMQRNQRQNWSKELVFVDTTASCDITQIQRADSEEKLNEAIEVLDSLDLKHSKFQKRLQKLLKRKEEWILFYRLDVMTRNNNTNNYSEASIRILKDIVLQRTKAFNLVALVEFTVYVWEEYFTSRLLKVAYNRNDTQTLLYKKLCSRVEFIVESNVRRLSLTDFEIKSCTNPEVWYSINVDLGVCSCVSGRQGGMCKHQAYIHKKFNICLPNEPPVNCDGRYLMAQLALGDRCPHPNFFKDLRDISTGSINSGDYGRVLTKRCSHLEDVILMVPIVGMVNYYLGAEPNSKTLLKKLENALETVTTPSSAMSALVYMRSSVISSRRRAGKIHVQPRTPARRRKGVSRGSRPIPMGRPTKVEVLKRALKKRPRNLSQNISQNVANAKSH